MNFLKYYNIFRVSLIIIPIIALGFFGYSYINPSGELIIEYNFCQSETPYFSGLSPHGRVLETEKIRNQNSEFKIPCVQRMVIDPVYFDVRLPQSYQRVFVAVDFQANTGAQQFDIGVGSDPANWDWIFNRSQALPSKHPWPYYVELDLAQAQFANNRYRFIVSAPGLDVNNNEIVFYNIKLKFTKEPLTRENVWQRFKNSI